MCRIISSDNVIGNFIIEAIENNKFEFSIENIIHFDEIISINLREHDYFTGFNYNKIWDFQENYPFFISEIEEDLIKINYDTNKQNKSQLIEQLKRYFRFGMPKTVIDEMISESKKIFR